MKSDWLNKKNLTCVVICAGKGTRMLPFTKEIPKPMILLKNKPILNYIIDYWKKYTQNFVFVVGYKKNHIINYVKKLDIKSEFVEQEELKGIAHAISLTKESVSENFIVALGDCLCIGNFSYPESMVQGVGVWETENLEYIKKNYAIIPDENKIGKVVEKPKKIYNNLCGMGVYFFNKKIFSYIDNASPSPLRKEIEITNVIQKMIESNEVIQPVFFNGEYVNITFPKDLKRAEKLITKYSSKSCK